MIAASAPRPEPVAFRIGRTGPGFTWEGEPWPGLPMLFAPCGRLIEPVLLHFAHSAASGRARPRSMKPECYALREYFAWLHWRGLDWMGATDRTLRQWRAWQSAARDGSIAARKRPPPSDAQIARKLSIVFRFHLDAPLAMRFGLGFPGPAAFVGPPRKGFPITSKETLIVLPNGDRVIRLAWAGALRTTRDGVRRDAPRAELVDRVLAAIRGRSATARHATDGAPALVSAERDWLMARCAAEAGLRAVEIASLALSAIAKALAVEGAWPKGRTWSESDALATMASDTAERTAVLSRLREYAAKGRTTVGVSVTCKGVIRHAPFPLGLLADLIEIGVWSSRCTMADAARRRAPSAGVAPVVFLSTRTGAGLAPGSVSDILKGGFDAAGVLGSGHGLRAAFAVGLALRLVEERLPLNRFVYDAQLERAVLLEVAQALGHADITVTVRHYVDLALMRLFRVPTTERLAATLSAHRALAEHAPALGPSGLALAADVVKLLARGGDQGAIAALVQGALTNAAKRARGDDVVP